MLLALSKHLLGRAAQPELCQEITWSGLAAKASGITPPLWGEAVALRVAKLRGGKKLAAGAEERLIHLIRFLAAAHPGSAALQRTALFTYRTGSPDRPAAEERLLPLPDCTVGDFTDAAHEAARRGYAARAKRILRQGESRFPVDAFTTPAKGWVFINLGEHAAELAAFEHALFLLKPGEVPGAELLAGLSLSQWLNNQTAEAIQTYRRLVETGRKLETPQYWAATKTISSKEWSEAAVKALEAVRVATLSRHPELLQAVFHFPYNFEPDPGVRIWRTGGDGVWLENYSGRTQNRFSVLRSDEMDGHPGLVLCRQKKENGVWINEPDFEVFFHLMGAPQPRIYFRTLKDGAWEKWSFLEGITFGEPQKTAFASGRPGGSVLPKKNRFPAQDLHNSRSTVCGARKSCRKILWLKQPAFLVDSIFKLL